jgi:LuxR family transcriptional regulator, maltose regulon positive regulatory protein
MERLISAALEARATHAETSWSCPGPIEPLTAAEQRVMRLLPTSTCPQIAANLYLSRSTVKTHLQSIHRKLGVASRTEAIERTVNLRLL